MTIRKTTTADIPAIMKIYADARQMMSDTGNSTQWTNGHPIQPIIEADIAGGLSYVCVSGDKILAVFYFEIAPEPSYAKIDGAWVNDEIYGVVHRIARAQDEAAKGAGAFCLEWCFAKHPNVRIDTHKNNTPMIELLKKLGYIYCGIIKLIETGDDRMAFQKV